jgi:hypothetical protein
MSSSEEFDLLDLERDIPTTPEDIRALRENRPRMNLSGLDMKMGGASGPTLFGRKESGGKSPGRVAGFWC